MTAYIQGKFGDAEYGTGATISWSNLPAEGIYDVPVFGRIYAYPIDPAFVALAPVVFQQWEAVANVKFVEADSLLEADIIAGAVEIDGPGGVLGLAVGNPSIGPFTAVGFDVDDFSTALDPAVLAPVLGFAVREFGNAIGLQSEDGPLAMAVPYSEQFATPIDPTMLEVNPDGPLAEPLLQPLSIAAVQYLYGAPEEYSSVWLESADLLFAASTGSKIMALGGDDVVIGRAGIDELHGGTGLDLLVGGASNDTLLGGEGDDTLFGNFDLDHLVGGAGNDILWGGQNAGDPDETGKRREGVETAEGGAGDDSVFGNFGNDMLSGGDGNDQVWGGQDNDTLDGGAGDDLMIGNKGDDHMTGGAGADLFFGHGGGADVVADFNAAEGDRLALPGPVTATSTSAAGNLVVHHEAGTMELLGIDPASWAPNDWVTIL